MRETQGLVSEGRDGFLPPRRPRPLPPPSQFSLFPSSFLYPHQLPLHAPDDLEHHLSPSPQVPAEEGLGSGVWRGYVTNSRTFSVWVAAPGFETRPPWLHSPRRPPASWLLTLQPRRLPHRVPAAAAPDPGWGPVGARTWPGLPARWSGSRRRPRAF